MREPAPESGSRHAPEGQPGENARDTAQPQPSRQQLLEELQDARLLAAQLEQSRTSHRRIGIATGVLMNSLRVPEATAFELLRRASMRQNIKLGLIAEYVILAGCLPDDVHAPGAPEPNVEA